MSRFKNMVIGGLCLVAGCMNGRVGYTLQEPERDFSEETIELEMRVFELEDMNTYQQNCGGSTALYIQELQKYIHELREENIKFEVREYFWQKEFEKKYQEAVPVQVDSFSL